MTKNYTEDHYYAEILSILNDKLNTDQSGKPKDILKYIQDIPESKNLQYGREDLNLSFSNIIIESKYDRHLVPSEILMKDISTKDNSFIIKNNYFINNEGKPGCGIDELIIKKDYETNEKTIPVLYAKNQKNKPVIITAKEPALKTSTFYKYGFEATAREIFDGVDTLIFSEKIAPASAVINIQDNIILGEKIKNILTIYHKNGGGILAGDGDLLKHFSFLKKLDCSGLDFRNITTPIYFSGNFKTLDLSGKFKNQTINFSSCSMQELILDYCIFNDSLTHLQQITCNYISLSHCEIQAPIVPSRFPINNCKILNLSFSKLKYRSFREIFEGKDCLYIDLNGTTFSSDPDQISSDYCFANCKNLIKIGGTASLPGDSAFLNCISLESIDLSSWKKLWGYENHPQLKISFTNCFKNCPKLTTVYYGDEVNLKKIQEHSDMFDDISKITFIAGFQP